MLPNPWLEIPHKDYVGHMNCPEVDQYKLINENFKYAVDKYKPKSIFVPGCTVGNGFEHINWNEVENVTALDINNEYLKVLSAKYSDQSKLNIINDDLLNINDVNQKFDLIYAALLFEYLDLPSAIKIISELMTEEAVLYSIIQLPCSKSKVSKTKYKSLEKLNSIMNLVDIHEFKTCANNNGLFVKSEKEITLLSGKSFSIIEFCKH